VLGISEAMSLPYLDIIWDFDFDSMHGIFLNVVLHLMTFWFSDAYASQPFSLFNQLNNISQTMKSIKIPHDFPKFPNLETFTNWKAAELRYFYISTKVFLT
jgi:hypothetical protein